MCIEVLRRKKEKKNKNKAWQEVRKVVMNLGNRTDSTKPGIEYVNKNNFHVD